MAKQKKAREIKTSPIHLLKADEGEGIVEAIFSVYGNVDQGFDIVEAGAFKKTFAEHGPKVRVLDQHNTDSVLRSIGVPLSLEELDKAALPDSVVKAFPSATGGAKATIQFLIDTPEGLGAFKRIKAGAIDEWSFAYETMQFVPDKIKINGETVRVRRLKELKLMEISPVLWGMNEATTTVSAKGIEDAPNFRDVDPEEDMDVCGICRFENGEGFCTLYEFDIPEKASQTCDSFQPVISEEEIEEEMVGEAVSEDEIDEAAKGPTKFEDLPLADRELEWDGSEAESNVRAWATNEEDEIDWDEYGRAFFWVDDEAADTLGGYKLGFADITDGSLMAIPRGVFAAAGAVQGARTEVDIPESDVDGVKSHIEAYYEKMADEFDDESIIAPWLAEDSGSDEEIETAADGVEGLTLDEVRQMLEEIVDNRLGKDKAGRVLSAANAGKITEALLSLHSVLLSAGAIDKDVFNVDPDKARDTGPDSSASPTSAIISSDGLSNGEAGATNTDSPNLEFELLELELSLLD